MSENDRPPNAWWATAPLPGAIGILHLNGSIDELLEKLAGCAPAPGEIALASLASIDKGLVVRTGESSALLMPHGGPRIRRLLTEATMHAGAAFIDAEQLDPMERWPEARNLLEACMLDTLARSASPRAVDLLLEQPGIHETAHERGWSCGPEELECARCLDHLVNPPLVAIVGAPNVGKSTLLNRLAGREVAITADHAGTTRDTVTARVELDGLACDIIDLPGERSTEDPIESHAISLARTFLREANLVIALVDPEHPQVPELERTPDLVICNKADLGSIPEHMPISALDGSGLPELAIEIRRMMIPDELLSNEAPFWIFHPALESQT